MNEQTVVTTLLWAYKNLTTDAAWAVIACYGITLAHIRKGDEKNARTEYRRARRHLRTMLNRGSYLKATKKAR